MALDPNKNCREMRSFRQCGPDSEDQNHAIATVDCSALTPGADKFDYVSNSPTATTDVWIYRDGGSGGTIVGEVTVTYTDATKCFISSVERTA